KVAGTMSIDEFREHWAFHQAHDFWVCSSKLTDKAIAEVREKLDSSLKRFGLTTNGEILERETLSGVTCKGRPTQTLDIRDAAGTRQPTLLTGRLESLGKHVRVDGAMIMAGWEASAGGLRIRAGVTLVVALALELLMVPHYVWV